VVSVTNDATVFSEADDALLLALLGIPTVNPLEGDGESHIRQAQDRYAVAAAAIGFEVVHHAPADAALLGRLDTPESVRAVAGASAESFLSEHPNLVLRLGPSREIGKTMMFNVHLDTVGGYVPIGFDGRRFTGRGAIDCKGPAVALLAGLREAVHAHPGLIDDISILVQAVPGEEGGCMGVFGTRALVEAGFVGKLNVFCEPTGHAFADCSTASMTLRVSVSGQDAIDDSPGAGHNATVILAHLIATFSRQLLPRAEALGARVCVAGCQTGKMHNRVYGSGVLLVNIAYESIRVREQLEAAVADVFERALVEIEVECARLPWLQMTAADVRRVTRLEWVKRGLPVLQRTEPEGEALMFSLGLERFSGSFTCDAIWMHDQPGYTVVYGPGGLSSNNAHAPGEYADRSDLDRYAQGISALVGAFHSKVRATP
jgi:acetylornithine deacetylase/succinyl-diaminopimelate desuccinylase-like protein